MDIIVWIIINIWGIIGIIYVLKIIKFKELFKITISSPEEIKRLDNIKTNKDLINTSNLKVVNLFTKYELIFYNELNNFLKWKNYLLLSKVRLADMIKQKYKTDYKSYMKTFNKVNRKHIDFIIADTKWQIKLLIELDWYSHNYKNTIKSDNLKNELFEKLNIPLLRFKNWYNHNLEILNDYI